MDLRQLRAFVAAAECGSISRAARRCGVTQPSLSQQVRGLEGDLGRRLFDRIGRGVALTEAGRSLLPRARRILREVGEAEAAIAGGGAAEPARLALGAIPTIAPYVLPGVAAALRRAHPEAEIAIREDLTERLLDALVDAEIDLAVASTPIDHPLVEVEVVGREAMVVVVPEGHRLRGSATVRPADLREEPAVMLHEMHCLGRQISEFCSARRLVRPIACRTTQLATVMELVRRGLGVSIVPAMAARHDAGGGLAFLPLTTGRPHREISILRRVGRTPTRLGRQVAEHVAARLRREAD